MGKLSLQKISAQDYHALTQIDKHTLYWLDDGTIYVGGKVYGGKFTIVESDPLQPELNTLYINLVQGTIKIFNGIDLIPITTGSTKLTHSLTIGDKIFDGTSDVVVEIYDGKIEENILSLLNLQHEEQANNNFNIQLAEESQIKDNSNFNLIYENAFSNTQ